MISLAAEIAGLDFRQDPDGRRGQIEVGLSRSMTAFILIVSFAGLAFAQPTCQQQLDQLSQQWEARHGHQHMGPVVTFMRDQLRSAAQLCNAGQEHEAMLRMDVVRAYLSLPEVAHPASHDYTDQGGKR
jgi:hypothetical protein